MAEKTQEQFEQYIKEIIERLVTTQYGEVNRMLSPEFVSCDVEKMEAVLDFPVLNWELNQLNGLHGGISAAQFDFAMAIPAIFLSDMQFTPTIQMDITYVKPVPAGETLRIKATLVSHGRTLINVEGKGYLKSSGKLAITARGTYFNVASKKG